MTWWIYNITQKVAAKTVYSIDLVYMVTGGKPNMEHVFFGPDTKARRFPMAFRQDSLLVSPRQMGPMGVPLVNQKRSRSPKRIPEENPRNHGKKMMMKFKKMNMNLCLGDMMTMMTIMTLDWRDCQTWWKRQVQERSQPRNQQRPREPWGRSQHPIENALMMRLDSRHLDIKNSESSLHFIAKK